MSEGHTQTPWVAGEDGSISEPLFGGDWIADVRPHHNRDANAAFIVCAVNSHDDLVAALTYARRFLREQDHDVSFVDAALAKASA